MGKEKKVGFWIVYIVYIIALFLDIITTFLVKHKEILEANMAYKYIGFTGIIILNILVIWLLHFLYCTSKSTPTNRFYLIMIMLLIVAMRIYALQNASYYISNPITIEEAVIIATPEAKMESMQTMAASVYPPMIFAIIGFLFWKLDHRLEKK